MPGSAISNQSALLVGSLPRGEADSLVRFLTPVHGSLTLLARGLRKPGSKLAGQLQPADELLLSAATGRGSLGILTAASCERAHPRWRNDLWLLSLYWFMLECSWLASSDETSNADGYRLLANLLRSDPDADSRAALAVVFCIRFLGLHGMLPDLLHDEETGERLAGDVMCRPAFEGLLAAEGNAPGMVRIGRERLERWRRLHSRPLLEYPEVPCDPVDVSMLVAFVSNQVSSMAGFNVRSAEFLSRQWKLSRLSELTGA